jgi:hypothetical protein
MIEVEASRQTAITSIHFPRREREAVEVFAGVAVDDISGLLGIIYGRLH